MITFAAHFCRTPRGKDDDISSTVSCFTRSNHFVSVLLNHLTSFAPSLCSSPSPNPLNLFTSIFCTVGVKHVYTQTVEDLNRIISTAEMDLTAVHVVSSPPFTIEISKVNVSDWSVLRMNESTEGKSLRVKLSGFNATIHAAWGLQSSTMGGSVSVYTLADANLLISPSSLLTSSLDLTSCAITAHSHLVQVTGNNAFAESMLSNFRPKIEESLSSLDIDLQGILCQGKSCSCLLPLLIRIRSEFLLTMSWTYL